MNRSELVAAVAAKGGVTRTTADRLVDVFFSSIMESLEQGDRVELRGLGTFHVREKMAYQGHNPRTREPIEIPVRRRPAFRMGKEIRDRLNARFAVDNLSSPSKE